MQYIEENTLIRKQREELVLLTNELKTQEVQISVFNEENLKLKNAIKVYEKKFDDYDQRFKYYDNQIRELKSKNITLT